MGRQLTPTETKIHKENCERMKYPQLGIGMPKMRTLDSGIKEIQEIDPNTQITKNALRKAVLSGDIPSKQIGAKRIFDLNEVWKYFSAPAPVSTGKR